MTSKGFFDNRSYKPFTFNHGRLSRIILQSQEIKKSTSYRKLNMIVSTGKIKPHQNFSVKIMWQQELQGTSYQIGYGAKII